MKTPSLLTLAAFAALTLHAADVSKIAEVEQVRITADGIDAGSGISQVQVGVTTPSGTVAQSWAETKLDANAAKAYGGRDTIRLTASFTPNAEGIWKVSTKAQGADGVWSDEEFKTAEATTPWRVVSVRTRWEPAPGNELWFDASPWSAASEVVVFKRNTVTRALNAWERIAGNVWFTPSAQECGVPQAANAKAVRLAVEVSAWPAGAGKTGAPTVTTSYLWAGEKYAYPY